MSNAGAASDTSFGENPRAVPDEQVAEEHQFEENRAAGAFGDANAEEEEYPYFRGYF
ncbi:hypothetical protein [Tumebacillus flagellatus]|uniref:hypothetical protein n=1 Tax=Tumebacillus flagellatus TaxID=1157490 RepID=UPI001376BCFE|nr:hypothetical protein [Tumebacillus flagellatus]